MSRLGGCLWEVAAYESLDPNRSKFPSLQYDNCRDPWANADAVFRKAIKSQFWKTKSGSSVSCTNKGCNNVYNTLLSIFRSIICQVVAYGRLKTKDNFKLFALKGVAVAY